MTQKNAIMIIVPAIVTFAVKHGKMRTNKMRLIDADALKKAIDLPFLDNTRLGKIINDAPTIEAEPVVRCKECRYWNSKTDMTYCDRLAWVGTEKDDYCSFAERREP